MLILLLSFLLSGPETAESVYARFHSLWLSTKRIETNFIESVSGMTAHKGSLAMEEERAFALDAGNEKIFSDGTTLWIVNKRKNTVTIDDVSSRSTSPRSTISKLLTGVEPRSIKRQGNTYELTLAQQASSDYTDILLTLSASTFLPEKIFYRDKTGNRHRIMLSRLRINPSFTKDRFIFSPPGAMKVIDLR